jgi:hypothetical protein
MNDLNSFFDSIDREESSHSGWSAPGLRAASETNVAIKFKETPGCLMIKASSQETYTSVVDEPQSPDLTININKTIDEFRTSGLEPEDLEIEGLTNRKSTNSKIINALDYALFSINGQSRIRNGLQSL